MSPKHDRVIVLDFDHTVFNTTKYKNKLADVFQKKFGIDRETFFEKREAVKECCTVIDFDDFVNSFNYEDDLEMHHAIEKVIRGNAEDWIFDDVIPFMETHKDKYDIILQTHGDEEQQKEKIDHSHLPHYVEHIISTKDKDEVFNELVKKYEEVYFFDDKAENIDAVKRAHPDVITYFVKRPEDSPYADHPSDCSESHVETEGLSNINL